MKVVARGKKAPKVVSSVEVWRFGREAGEGAVEGVDSIDDLTSFVG